MLQSGAAQMQFEKQVVLLSTSYPSAAKHLVVKGKALSYKQSNILDVLCQFYLCL